ncbi:MAG: hypothetical protein AAB649_07150 [Patescibacteria group bacterium]
MKKERNKALIGWGVMALLLFGAVYLSQRMEKESGVRTAEKVQVVQESELTERFISKKHHYGFAYPSSMRVVSENDDTKVSVEFEGVPIIEFSVISKKEEKDFLDNAFAVLQSYPQQQEQAYGGGKGLYYADIITFQPRSENIWDRSVLETGIKIEPSGGFFLHLSNDRVLRAEYHVYSLDRNSRPYVDAILRSINADL